MLGQIDVEVIVPCHPYETEWTSGVSGPAVRLEVHMLRSLPKSWPGNSQNSVWMPGETPKDVNRAPKTSIASTKNQHLNKHKHHF